MKSAILSGICCALFLSCAAKDHPTHSQVPSKITLPVDFSRVRIHDTFWSPRLDKHVSATLPICIDQIENQTGRMRNFENAAQGSGKHSGIFFDDSDVYKALEGMSYSLINHPDPALKEKADEWVAKIAAAQQPDGYINTYYTLTGLDRWTDMDKHEMYCAGHLIEAAIAYTLATGEHTLLEVAMRMADHMMTLFGPGKRHWVPGHEEVELALVKLYSITGERKYLDFAHWLLEERGCGHGSKGSNGTWNKAYYQDSVPVRDLTDITGHAVRCMYLFCSMADVAAFGNDTSYLAALDRVWDDVVLRNMYITGGIGSSHQNEGFTGDYDLPNLEAYCETCASVGMVLWNERMNRLKGEAKYADVMERALYNGALAGISLDGDRFFYVNPLESRGDHHRKAWYGCACCPSQLSRLLPSLGSYIYALSLDTDTVWVNLYIGSSAEIPLRQGGTFTLEQETRYPWEGAIMLTVREAPEKLKKELRLRIPGWCKEYTLSLNGKRITPKVEKGYAVLNRTWKNDDRIELDLSMPAEAVAADPRVKANAGKLAVQRGPLVYCMEETDNPQAYDKAAITNDTPLSARFIPTLLDGVVEINADTPGGVLRLIPYYGWDNREAGRMKVWIDKR